jgi:hypothetical protein
MVDKFYADVEYMAAWARHIIATRDPNFVIQENYLRRWWIVPRNHFQNVYLHEINESDDARALHDHPWDNVSFILAGSYTEITPEGETVRNPGDVVYRTATDAHRLIIPDGGQVLSLFLTGPIVREWGFHCPKGWRHWKDFVDLGTNGQSSLIGRGCED